MRKLTIGVAILFIIMLGLIVPSSFSGEVNSAVITYGETTHANSDYKSDVDSFFKEQSNVDLNNVDEKIITADEVNKVSSTITGKTYGSDQVFSSALVDLNENDDLEVSVDKSKINTITGDMYISALKSVGITSGHVYVTSPVSATGESALTGIMNSYEVVTDVEIPDNVKEAANNEIFTQAEIVENSDVEAEKLSDLVDDVKETVQEENVTDHDTIVNIINNYTVTNNINITNADIENLANSIEQIQNVQGDINNYETQVSTIFNNTTNTTNSTDNIGGNTNDIGGLLSGLFNQ